MLKLAAIILHRGIFPKYRLSRNIDDLPYP